MLRRSKQFFRDYGWILMSTLLLISALFVMRYLLQHAPDLVSYYLGLLAFSLIASLVLIAILARSLIKLYRQYQRGESGIQTTVQLSGTLSLLLAVPIIILFYFSLSVIHQSIDQWFDLQTEQALRDASSLVRTNLDNTTRDQLNATLRIKDEFRDALIQRPAFTINEVREALNAQEVALYQSNGQLIAFSNEFGLTILPERPADNLLQQIRQRTNYAALETHLDTELDIIRVLVPVIDPFLNQTLALQAIFTVPDHITRYAESVRLAESQYQELNYLRQPLKTSFSLLLFLVVLGTLVSTILFTIQAVQNLTKPIRQLIQSTQRVADGDYTTVMPVERRDEFGRLIQSFNVMTQQVAKARNDIKLNHHQTELEKLYFQAVIRNLTNGVITFDTQRRLRTFNNRAVDILQLHHQPLSGQVFSEVFNDIHDPHLAPLTAKLVTKLQKPQTNLDTNELKNHKNWTFEVTLQINNQQHILRVQGASLTTQDHQLAGYVLVLDDITDLVQAQRHAAWGDVARRLAHEIKNPLTPIQLSAERLAFKLAPKLDTPDQALLDRMTRTITQQVQSMQELVQAFSDYAHTPELNLTTLDLNDLVTDITTLYQASLPSHALQLSLCAESAMILADTNRIRQLLHNLIKNAIEALEHHPDPQIHISTRLINRPERLCLSVKDNGPGIPNAADNWVFEPYATNKPKGTGLGLAIVKKIIEEHQANIELNTHSQGTEFIICFNRLNKDGH
ncbi:ATP-binding protein [Thiomicrospira sp. ALE5]|uniref:sensor histidine kinase n=1 Tax=Thiomicrospira sp. ALE5 TaxID=748650 RepID=UPI0008E1F596|nr:ATP-binding protein [Thiomicrospira sp. ALE5]SFR55181.1 Signal transduction histidine kinase involved in nitrogen fixation and metabolism regulation [Thiomicrospira sp. ALE5]